jgi:hypothetical protein
MRAGYAHSRPASGRAAWNVSEAGAIPALSRNRDAPRGDEPGRLLQVVVESPRKGCLALVITSNDNGGKHAHAPA